MHPEDQAAEEALSKQYREEQKTKGKSDICFWCSKKQVVPDADNGAE